MKNQIKGILRFTFSMSLLFIGAGSIRWAGGWLFVLASVVIHSLNYLLLRKYNPVLIEERGKFKKTDIQKFDKVILAFYLPLQFLFSNLLAGLLYRFHLAHIPASLAPLGFLLYLASSTPILWAMASNPHLEPMVRIQNDREHRVISSGPYQYVRHPMYLGMILNACTAPLVLGSTCLYLVSAVSVVLIVVRTYLEDSFLEKQLPGYSAYSQKTKYRIVPFIW